MTDLVGRTLGDYQVEALIGTGSIGQVYRARHVALRRVQVALKALDPRITDNPEFKEPYARYRETITALDHAHVVTVDHFGEHAGLAYIVMELLPGRTCESLRPPVAAAVWAPSSWRTVELIRQAAEGVAAAHDKGIVHGDIKPSNLLLTADDPSTASVKVTDFGLRRLAREAQAIDSGVAAGLADARHDIAALGRVLYELTTGRLPPQDAVDGATGANVVPRLLVGYPKALESIVLRCLSSRPDDWFASALELSRTLGTAISAAGAAIQLSAADVPDAAIGTAVGLAASVVGVRAKPPHPPGPLPGTVPALHVMNADGTSITARHLRAAGLTVGSASGGDVVIDSPDVSPVHLRVDWDGRKVLVTDLGSVQGTRLEGHRLLPQVAQEWGREQWLQIGPYWLWIQQPAAPVSEAVVEVMLDHGSRRLTLTPGKPSTCHVTLVNQTMHVDHVTLSVEGISAEWVDGARTETWLSPNAKKELPLTVTVPRTPAGRAGEYRVTIRVNSIAHPEVEQGSATAHWTVLPFHAMHTSISPSRSKAARQAQYTITLQNGGNVAASYTLHGSDGERHLEYLFSGEGTRNVNHLPVVVQPAMKTDIRLDVVARRLWVGASSTHAFAVEAVSDDERPGVTADAHFVHRPMLPWWALAAVPVLVLAVAVFGQQYLKPIVRTVYVEPRTPRSGEPIEVSWDAPKARQIRLFVNDLAVQPDPDPGEGRYVFSEGFTRDTRIRISGSNIFGEASSQISIIVIPSAPPPDPPPPIVQMTVNPPLVAPGGAVTVTWMIKNAIRVDFDLTGTVELQGVYVDRPIADHTYTIKAVNEKGVTTTRSIPVRVIPGEPPDPVPRLMLLTPPPRNNAPATIDVGDSVVFEWEARHAQSVRIDTVTPVKLEGSSGQRTAELKGEGRYIFTLVATNATNEEFRSEPVVVTADCGFLDGLRKLFKCNKTLEVKWK